MAKTQETESTPRLDAANLSTSAPSSIPRLRSARPRLKLPEGFQPLQHPKLVSAPPSNEGWRHEVKLDGYRMQLRVEGKQGRWFSRNGHEWTERLADFDVSGLADGIYDGEVCAVDAKGHPDFSALRSAMGFRQRGRLIGDLVYFIFDMLVDGGCDLRPMPLTKRRERLSKALAHNRNGRVGEVTALPGGGPELLTAACRMELEGIVSKRLDAPYTGGDRRLDTWVKSKCRPGQEVVIGGYEAEGARFKALVTGVYEHGKLTYVGHVGTGYPQTTIVALLSKLRPLETDASPFEAGSPPKKGVRWVRPELVANVEIAEWNRAGKMRQASFKGLREDKLAFSVVRERAT